MATVLIFSQDVRPAPEVPTVHGVTDKDLDNIVSNVSAKYHRVLIHLGLSSNAIETLEIKHHKDPARVLFEGLVQWRKEKPRSSHCLWEELLKAIEEGAENEMYAEEWRTELRERGIRTCEHRPEMKDWGDVTGSHLGSTASASAAELKTRSGTSLRRRHLLPQQQQQQQQQQQPVQKRSDKPCSSQDASSRTSANRTKTSDLNGRSSSNRSAYCHSPSIATVPIGLHQKAPSPAIAQDDLMELHQSLIQYTQVACRLVRHRETGIVYLNAVADYLQLQSLFNFKTSGIAKIAGIGLLIVGTFLVIVGHFVYHIYNPIADLHSLSLLITMVIFGMLLMLVGSIVLIRNPNKNLTKFHELVNDTYNWAAVFHLRCLQFKMAYKAFLLQLNAIMQEYRINNRYDVLRLNFNLFRKDHNTHFTLEHFLFAQRQIEDSSKIVSFFAADAVAKSESDPLARIEECLRLVVLGCPFVFIVARATVSWNWFDTDMLRVAIISSAFCLLFTWAIILNMILGKKRCNWWGTIYRSLDVLVSYQTKALRPLAELFDSIIPGRLIWLRKTRHELLFS